MTREHTYAARPVIDTTTHPPSPWVEFSVDGNALLISPATARDVAAMLVRCADGLEPPTAPAAAPAPGPKPSPSPVEHVQV